MLAGYDDGDVTVTVGDTAMRFARDEVALCRLRIDF